MQDRVTKNFSVAKSRVFNEVTINDYLLSAGKRTSEDPLNDLSPEAYKQALFYMYGACEGLNEDKTIVHNLLRRHAVWNGTQQEAD
jgi:hypothetical protein